MEKSVVIDTFLLDVLLVDEEGQHIPKPMITIIIDSASQAIIDVNISTANPRSSSSDTEH
ncbi:hypothetical protein MO767_27010 [Pseudomonas sp. UYIF39]|uniref:hypothetical protein n=1 Tax=Pseudomonas sp. UYIF39 TaxID=1630747 RepID=UPI00249F46F2|nr:hypothetical protein [Pseudomonas sp. UYIF39]MDI3357964.1 hypothetical protein [Pseudomonas sp. UYIF39]